MANLRSAFKTFIALVLAAPGCDEAAPPAAPSVRDSANSRIVELFSDPFTHAPTELQPAQVLDLSSTTATRLTSVVSIGQDLVAAADPHSSEVILIDIGNGSHTRVGNKGRGPGEYEAPEAAVAMADTLVVWDAWINRLLLYALSGEPIATVEVPSVGDIRAIMQKMDTDNDPPYRRVRGGSQGVFVQVEDSEFSTGESQPRRGYIIHLEPRSLEADTVATYVARPRTILPDGGSSGQIAFAPTFLWDARGNTIAYAPSSDIGRVIVRTKGLPDRAEIRWSAPLKRATAADVLAHARAGFAENSAFMSEEARLAWTDARFEEVARTLPRHGTLPVVGGLFLLGRCVAIVNHDASNESAGQGRRMAIIDINTGNQLGLLALPDRQQTISDMTPQWIISRDVAPLGVPRILLYRVPELVRSSCVNGE